VTVHNPASGSHLVIGSAFTLRWTVDSGRRPSIDILLSTDGGATYQSLAESLTNTSAYDLILPDKVAERCRFRVNARVEGALLGYNLSPEFSLVAPPPSPTPSPAPTEAPRPLPDYVPVENAFIPAGDDATRYFLIEHDLGSVAAILWQVSALPFPCADLAPEQIPGLLAYGKLSGDAREFALDFAALLSRYEVKDGQKPVDFLPNQGSPFETITGSVLLPQSQRNLYIRAVALDEKDKPLVTPGMGFQVVYGQMQLDLGYQALAGMPVETSLSLTAQQGADNTYGELTAKGVAVWAATADNWPFSLENIPVDAVSIDVQLSATPFTAKNMQDFTDPAGLVHRSRVDGLSYTPVARYYHWNFADFAPSAQALGGNTIRYYLRAVCLVPDGPTGSVRPVISPTIPVYYTGDVKVMIAIAYEMPEPEPEQVVVKSSVPYTTFQRYITAQWPIAKSEQYFEVTRRIQAEEMSFSITNNKTGDFLLPFKAHLYHYPGTTRAQYQEKLDQMLPVGAWFHLTLTESTWSKLWDEFTELARQTYDGIRNAYNGIKAGVAVFIADRFTFLGPQARNLIEKAVIGLIDAGLASIGLPPNLPNFEAMVGQGLDYCLKVALAEASASLGVPINEVPLAVQDQVTQEVKQRIESLAQMNRINPLKVDFLKPAAQAMHRPAYIDVRIYNQHATASPTGTLTVSFYPVSASHYNFYRYVTLPVPSLQPSDETTIRVYLRHDNTDHIATYKKYYFGDGGDCLLTVRVKYDVPDLQSAAAAQGAGGSDPNRPDEFVFDYNPIYEFRAKMPPGDNIYPANQLSD
jgi:hypothetical protein